MLDLSLRDLVDATFRLLTIWSTQSPHEMERLNSVYAYFRDRETEYETGVPVLPSWASIGNVAAMYGVDDSDPFAQTGQFPPDDQ